MQIVQWETYNQRIHYFYVYCLLSIFCYLVSIVYCLLSTVIVYCLLSIAYCLYVYCPLSIVHCLLSIVYWSTGFSSCGQTCPTISCRGQAWYRFNCLHVHKSKRLIYISLYVVHNKATELHKTNKEKRLANKRGQNYMNIYDSWSFNSIARLRARWEITLLWWWSKDRLKRLLAFANSSVGDL